MKASHQILQDIIAFPSVTGNYDANHQAIEYIDRFLSERGMFVKRFEFNGFESLVATTQRTKTPTVMLLGHVDVVPAEADQFTLREADGKFFGRGVLDMKGAVAAYLQVIDSIQNNLSQYDLGIMIVTDEEVGGYDGVVPLIEAGYLPKMCVIPDGGGNWSLETFAKGLWLFDIEAEGNPAHGSRPWEGENAIDKLMQAIAEIKQIFPVQSRDTSTCTLAQIKGGEAVNQVAAKATASFDMRFASVEDEKNIMNAVKLVCKKYNVHVTDAVYSAPCINDPENHYLKSFSQSIEKAIGYPAGTTISLAGSDGRFFAAKGIPCAIFYPVGGGHHGLEEWISTESYEQLQQILLDYVKREARIPVQRHAAHIPRSAETVSR